MAIAMKKIVIIGGGFAGISAAIVLRDYRFDFDITLIDKKPTFDFLPMLPDCIGRGIRPEVLTYKIKDICEEFHIKFVNTQVSAVNLEAREVVIEKERLFYDYLVIASGSETNFYDIDFIKNNAYKLDDALDAKKLVSALKENNFDNYVVGGGGYTGVEVATNLSVFLKKSGRTGKVLIVEHAPSILGALPQWMKDYTNENLRKLNIEVITGSTIEKVVDRYVYISSGKNLSNSLLVWAGGVKTASFIQDLSVDKNPQGRIKVDRYLRLNDTCFVIGDAAYVSYKNNFLRMAIQFSITQGYLAAGNIVRSTEGISLKEYQPLDLGYIIPMANNKSCGEVLGFDLKGRIPTLLHFLMCVYRSRGLRNKLGVIADLLKGGEK